ncbi:MAG TPA: type II toxin-antitoxin system HigB family toxin [Thermoanaerobaculia bacterium]|nr:type II toxin-antitoxin system HigB family toxin [Thermoanaerobaculia bacterium]
MRPQSLPDLGRIGMKLLGLNVLSAFAKAHPDAEPSLSAWQAEVERATWKHGAELKGLYPSASFVGRDNVIFNIRGNNYRLHARVSFATQVVIVVQIGTHKEYEGWKY